MHRRAGDFVLLIEKIGDFGLILVGERDRAQVQTLENHQILRQRACLVREQVTDAAQFFWNGTRADDRAGYVCVALNKPGIDGFAHVEIHAQTDGYHVGEEEKEANEIPVPRATEAFEHEHGNREKHERGKEQLRQRVDLRVQEADLRVRLAGVHDHACVRAGVDHAAYRLAGGHDRARPEHVLDGQRLVLLPRDDAVELMDVQARRFGVNLCRHALIRCQNGDVVERLSQRTGDAQLPIRLAIELIRTNETRSCNTERKRSARFPPSGHEGFTRDFAMIFELNRKEDRILEGNLCG